MLGSHNSLSSYSHPWWQFIFCPFSKCQSKNLTLQYVYGVRFFDFRIKVYPDGRYKFAHGLMTYKGTLSSALDTLNAIANPEDPAYFRVMLEYNKPPKDEDMILNHFKDIIRLSYFHRSLDNLVFFGAYKKWDGYTDKGYSESVIRVSYKIDYPVVSKYSSVLGWKRYLWCIPYVYAKLFNRKFKREYKDVLESKDKILMLDFI